MTLVSHQKRLAKNLQFEKEKHISLQNLLRCHRAYTALTPHRTYRLKLIVQNWTKGIKLIRDVGVLLLFAIVFLYRTYLNGNCFAVALIKGGNKPSAWPSAPINKIKKCFSAFLNNDELGKIINSSITIILMFKRHTFDS